MHEGHFTENIVDAVVLELKKYPGRRVESITVKVGETYHLVADSVLMHFELITKETALEGVKLNLLEEPMLVVCSQCAKQGPVEDHHLLLCSYCHSRQVKPVAGNTVTIEQIKFIQ
jgi:hydrogenase nickel incorporation protein HypA/HybF